MTDDGERIATIEAKIDGLEKRQDEKIGGLERRQDKTDGKIWWFVAAMFGVVVKYVSDAVRAGAGQ